MGNQVQNLGGYSLIRFRMLMGTIGFNHSQKQHKRKSLYLEAAKRRAFSTMASKKDIAGRNLSCKSHMKNMHVDDCRSPGINVFGASDMAIQFQISGKNRRELKQNETDTFISKTM